MKRNKIVILLFFLVFFIPIGLSADETNSINLDSFGILAYTTAKYNSLGFIYHFTPDMSFRPSFLLYIQDASWKDYGASIDMLYYIKQKNRLFIITGLGFNYYYHYTHYKYSDGDKYKAREDNVGLSIIIGAQYMFTDQFGFFADTGITYSRQREKWSYYDNSTGTSDKNTSWNNIVNFRSANLGAVFYF